MDKYYGNNREINNRDRPEKNRAGQNGEGGELKEQLRQLQAELAAEKERNLRARADFDNYRRRTEREAEKTRLYAKKDVLLDLLTFLDYFEQALKQVRDTDAARGIEIMARQFYDLLRRHGVEPVECLGKPFDPEEQEGIGYTESDECPEGCVAEEICCGYKLGDILLKPARVMVAKKPDR